jgi:hypothetical protein
MQIDQPLECSDTPIAFHHNELRLGAGNVSGPGAYHNSIYRKIADRLDGVAKLNHIEPLGFHLIQCVPLYSRFGYPQLWNRVMRTAKFGKPRVIRIYK